MSTDTYLIIGGDKRQEYLYNNLKRENKKVEKIFLNEDDDIDEATKKIYTSNIIVLPIPLTKDGENIFTPMYKEKIPIDYIAEKIPKDSIVFLGGNNEKIQKIKTKKIVDLLSNEPLTLKNAMATAEAALSIIINNVNHTIFGSEILIIGYGRIAKILSEYLLALKGNLSVCARNDIARTKANLKGIKTFDFTHLKSILPNYSIIINTVPALILKSSELNIINKNTLIIDLVSSPGGVDFKAVEKYGIKAIQALALPGKFSPKSAAEFIEQAINSEIT